MLVIVKKYSNRRLYDTEDSRYVTLEELAAKVRGGTDVRVVDAKSGQDLTQSTLVQIVLEGRGAARLLPSALLVQLIRMEDDALADFLGRYVAWALEVYNHARGSVAALNPLSALTHVPAQAAQAVARLLTALPGWPAPPPPPARGADDLEALRREVAALRDELRRAGRA
jgi:polyhydroxyalkanoate synthesis repressor PhaR